MPVEAQARRVVSRTQIRNSKNGSPRTRVKWRRCLKSTGLSAHGDESSGGIPLIQILRDSFEGMKGRQPNSDQELKEWLATGEGKEAESSLTSRFAEIGQS